jgi:hypothetical protein
VREEYRSTGLRDVTVTAFNRNLPKALSYVPVTAMGEAGNLGDKDTCIHV